MEEQTTQVTSIEIELPEVPATEAKPASKIRITFPSYWKNDDFIAKILSKSSDLRVINNGYYTEVKTTDWKSEIVNCNTFDLIAAGKLTEITETEFNSQYLEAISKIDSLT